MRNSEKLTPEQEEIRIHGLRILAGLIARRHLSLMRAESGEAIGPFAGDLDPDLNEKDSVVTPGQSIAPSEEADG